MKKIVLSIAFVCISILSFAQTKTGTFDTDFVLSKMPELAKVQEDLKAYNTTLEADLKAKVDAYQALIKEYQAKEATLNDADKKTKQQEILTAESDIAKFRQNGAGLVQLKQEELLRPLYQKIGAALNEIAKAQGYSQVFTIGNNLAYIDPKFDLTEAVLTKLGIKLEKK
ncbi:OmpH/Skp family outer membrane protein [Aquimarina rhabdastrellae]